MDEAYEYNAPKYVDFEASLCESDASADRYFDEDHENPNKGSNEKTYGNIRQSWDRTESARGGLRSVTMEMLKEAAKMKRNTTPERKALRQAVAKTIESVSNSPKLLLTKRVPHLSSAKSGRAPSLVVPLKAGTSSRRLSGGAQPPKKEAAPPAQSIRLRNILKKTSKEPTAPSAPPTNRGPLKATGPVKGSSAARLPPSKDPPLRGRTFERSNHARNLSCGPALASRGSQSRAQSKDRGQPAKYVSTAEAIMNMQRSTPDRFRSLPHNAQGAKARSRSISPGSVVFRRTQPRSPQLMTKCRSRPTQILSSEELMNNELREMRKHQFKARAVGEGIKPTKFPEMELRPGTIPQPFKLTESRHKKTSQEEIHTENFKANPVPKNIFQHPVGIPEKKTAPTVTPASPNFATKGRVKSREKINKHFDSSESVDSVTSSDSVVFKARPAPHFGIPTSLPPQPKKATVVQPFSFDNKITQTELKKKEKIQEILERERKEREFKAHPLPNFDKPINLPIKEHIMPTKVEPFNLDIEKRVEARLKKWEENIEQESLKQKEATKFKARPAKLGVPFVPEPSSKPLVEISNFELHTDRRAIEREAFELHKKEKEVEILELKRLREDQAKLEEEEEIRRLRKEAVIKSNPIRKYAPIKIHPSDKPVTEAKSPNFVHKKNQHQSD